MASVDKSITKTITNELASWLWLVSYEYYMRTYYENIQEF